MVDLPILGWLIFAESAHELVIVPAQKEVAIFKFTVLTETALCIDRQTDKQTDRQAIVIKS